MAKDAFDLVIGLGVSGRSVIRYLADQGMPVRALDTRDAPAGLDELREQHPKLKVHTGGFKASWMKRAQRLIVSPGVAVSTPAIAEQIAHAHGGHTALGSRIHGRYWRLHSLAGG